MRRSQAATLLGLLALVWGCAAEVEVAEREAARPAPAGPAPSELNVVLITIDTLRADRLSAYGHPRPTSPAIDRLAAEGVLFERAFAPRGLTWPSLSSILTSLYPGSHGVRDNGDWLAADKRSIAEILHAEGVTTAAFLTNMTSAPNRGFDDLETFTHKTPGVSEERPSDLLATAAALDWLGAHGEERFFLWLHLLAPHASYLPPVPYDRAFTRPYDGPLDGRHETLTRASIDHQPLSSADLDHVLALYDGEVALVDDLVGLLLGRLDELGLAGRTVVVLTADHGEELHQRHDYFYHRLSIYDSVLRVPLVWRLPGVLPAGRRAAEVVELVDLAPTLLELLELEVPNAFQGRSLLPLMGAGPPAEPWEGVAYAEIEETITSVRTGRWRYVANPLGTWLPIVKGDESGYRYTIAAEELYDLESDPGESRNVAGSHPEVVAELHEKLLAWRRRTETAERAGRPLDEETLEQLRALGYVQ